MAIAALIVVCAASHKNTPPLFSFIVSGRGADGMFYLWFLTIVAVYILPDFFPDIIKESTASGVRVMCVATLGAVTVHRVMKK